MQLLVVLMCLFCQGGSSLSLLWTVILFFPAGINANAKINSYCYCYCSYLGPAENAISTLYTSWTLFFVWVCVFFHQGESNFFSLIAILFCPAGKSPGCGKCIYIYAPVPVLVVIAQGNLN